MTKISPLWHPFTQHKTFGPALEIVQAQGAHLTLKTGGVLIDGISSWWVNTHGHCHPKIVAAVQAQAAKLDQIIFAGFTHEAAEKLARKLLKTAQTLLAEPLGIPRSESPEFVFLSDSGSTSVEVALKMALGYFVHSPSSGHTGPKRTKIVALEGGYHGDTFGAMSTGGRSVYNALYEPLLFDVHHLPFPHKGKEKQTLHALEQWLKKHGDETAAFIFEPLVQGAGGMRIISPKILKALHDLCHVHGVLTIADEVMTGFGRTGTFFACEQAGICPDLICLSKGLTGGFLPMGATLATRKIYKAFYHNDKARQFFHSSSFTGNPLSCAAALANLKIWEEEPVFESIKRIETAHKRAAGWFVARPDVENVRVLGTILAFDIIGPNHQKGGYLSALGPFIYNFMLQAGVLLRPLGNTVYILPPYCITPEDLEHIYEALWRSLDHLRNEGLEPAL